MSQKKKFGCKLEKITICSHCLSEFHLGPLHEIILNEEAVNLALIEKGMEKILYLKDQISQSGNEITSFINKIVEDVGKNLIEKKEQCLK